MLIKTKYHGPTNTLPARVIATSTAGGRVVVYNCDSVLEAHNEAAQKLFSLLELPGEKAGEGWIRVSDDKSGFLYVHPGRCTTINFSLTAQS